MKRRYYVTDCRTYSPYFISEEEAEEFARINGGFVVCQFIYVGGEEYYEKNCK